MTTKKTIKGVVFRLVGQYRYKKDAETAMIRAKKTNHAAKIVKTKGYYHLLVGD